MNLRNLPSRVGTSLVVVVGIAGVVGVLVSVLAMSEGFRHTLASTGRGDRVIMLRAGSDAELSSGVERDQATLLAALPGVARDGAGRPLASAELVVMVDLPRKGETIQNVPFRGVQRPRSTSGRGAPRGGPPLRALRREVVVGASGGQFAGFGRLAHRLPRRDWTVVGIFESAATCTVEIWADAEVAMSAFRRTGYQSVTAGSPTARTRPRAFRARSGAIAASRSACSASPSTTPSRRRAPAHHVLGYGGHLHGGGATFGPSTACTGHREPQVEIAPCARSASRRAGGVSVMIEALLLSLLGGRWRGLAYVYCDGARSLTLTQYLLPGAFDFP